MIQALHWLRPEWLWGLLAVPAAAWLAWRLRNGRDPWAGVIDPVLRPHVLEDGGTIPRGRWSPLWVAVMVLPAWSSIEPTLDRSRRTVAALVPVVPVVLTLTV